MSLFFVVSIAIALSAFFGFLARLARQPIFIGYLLAGVMIGFFGFFSHENRPLLEGMAQLGITFLLFLVGLEMNMKDIKAIGRVAVITGLGQIVFTILFGFLISLLLGFPSLTALYIAIALAFSSTIVIVQLLTEKHDLNSLYGKIAIGFLLIQDLVAIFLLVFLSGFQNSSGLSFLTFLFVVLKGVVLILVIYVLSKFALPKIFDKLALASRELLYIASIGWALIVASIIGLPQIGFSPEIGGFLAGLALARSSSHLQISARVKPLRDFFITIFFLLLGTKLVIDIDLSLFVPAIVLSIFILIGNPLIVLSLLGFLGYKRRTAFFASTAVAQISEFSFILVALGAKIGHVATSIVGLIAVIGVITMSASTYMILHTGDIFKKLDKFLRIFERSRTKEKGLGIQESFSKHVVLIGADRTGSAILPTLKKLGFKTVVVDFNPRIIERLSNDPEITPVYGDISDDEVLEALNLDRAKLVIVTSRRLQDGLLLLEKVKKLDRKPIVILFVSYPQEALELYRSGADYVIVPKIVGGEYLSHILDLYGMDKKYLGKLKEKHFDQLARERFSLAG